MNLDKDIDFLQTLYALINDREDKIFETHDTKQSFIRLKSEIENIIFNLVFDNIYEMLELINQPDEATNSFDVEIDKTSKNENNQYFNSLWITNRYSRLVVYKTEFFPREIMVPCFRKQIFTEIFKILKPA